MVYIHRECGEWRVVMSDKYDTGGDNMTLQSSHVDRQAPTDSRVDTNDERGLVRK